MSRRTPTDRVVRIPRRWFVAVTAVLAVLVALGVILGVVALARANEPIVVAGPAQLQVQKAAAERDVERAYEQATEQVRKVRALNLAITAADADRIAAKALSDLHALRHSAFVSLGQVMGLAPADAESYAATTDARFDQAPVSTQTASPAPVLLAPRYYLIVSRMSDLATQLSDQATTALTASPASPSPSPRPSASPSPTPRPSVSPSPTR